MRPKIRSAMNGWMQRMTLTKITEQRVVDGLVQNVEKSFTLRGTIQPLNPRQIELKPEGQRAWQWLQIHVKASHASLLQPNDIIKYLGKTYKIMGQNDYSLNGYVEYHAVKDYQKGYPNG